MPKNTTKNQEKKIIEIPEEYRAIVADLVRSLAKPLVDVCPELAPEIYYCIAAPLAYYICKKVISLVPEKKP